MECPHCNKEIPGKACPHCGAIIPIESHYCMDCGENIEDSEDMFEEGEEFEAVQRRAEELLHQAA